MSKSSKKGTPSAHTFTPSNITIPDHRSESEVIADLEAICVQPGFAHSLALICWRSNFFGYDKKLTSDDLQETYNPDHLIRSELSLLTRLMLAAPLDLTKPSSITIEHQIQSVEKLLQELHTALNVPYFLHLQESFASDDNSIKQDFGKRHREPIFYSGESAYHFQYRDFSIERYSNDDSWILRNKGFQMADVAAVYEATTALAVTRLKQIQDNTTLENIDELTLLPAFRFSVTEISNATAVSAERVRSIVEAFSIPDISTQEAYRDIGAWNCLATHPIIPLENDEFMLFQPYSLAESLYDTPIYWMRKDDAYRNTAEKHRGDFTETFSASRLASVFGADRVFQNVMVYDKKGRTVGEIDVLVLYADRAVVLQAKSKKLTEAARKGIEGALQDDLQKAVNSAYDQAYDCAALLLDGNHRLVADDVDIEISEREICEVFLLCVTSEFFPGLPLYAYDNLEIKKHDAIRPPYIIDVFLLDVLCELLTSPLYLLSYIHRRAEFAERINTSSELAVLGFHLTQNLWFEESMDFVTLGEDFSAHIDTAMLGRRTNVEADILPGGILTHYGGTLFGSLISQIEQASDSKMINLGFLLLAASSHTAKEISNAIEFTFQQAQQTGRVHDFTIAFGESGLTAHCGHREGRAKHDRLMAHCEMAKHRSQANTWYGLAFSPIIKGEIELAVGLNYAWNPSANMDEVVRQFSKQPSKSMDRAKNAPLRSVKIRANATCPCGSGKKYKKCCRP